MDAPSSQTSQATTGRSTHFVAAHRPSPSRTAQSPFDNNKDTGIPDEARAAATVYQWWTGNDEPAPWLSSLTSATTASNLEFGARSTRGNGLDRLDDDLCGAIRTAVPRALPYCGAPVNVGDLRSNLAPLRIMVVFWSPSKLVAARKTVGIKSSSEAMLLSFLDHLFCNKKLRAVVRIAYLLPRWVPPSPHGVAASYSSSSAAWGMGESRTGVSAPGGGGYGRNHSSKMMLTHPALLGYGVWQLGLRICLNRPHAVVTTNADLARIVSYTGGLDPRHVCSEAAKKTLMALAPPPEEPAAPDTDMSGCPVDPKVAQFQVLQVCEVPRECAIKRRIIDLDQLATVKNRRPIGVVGATNVKLEAKSAAMTATSKRPTERPPVKKITLQHPSKSGPGTNDRSAVAETLHHFRCPHPYRLTRKTGSAQDFVTQQKDEQWLYNTVDLLRSLAIVVGKKIKLPPKPRVILRLGGGGRGNGKNNKQPQKKKQKANGKRPTKRRKRNPPSPTPPAQALKPVNPEFADRQCYLMVPDGDGDIPMTC